MKNTEYYPKDFKPDTTIQTNVANAKTTDYAGNKIYSISGLDKILFGNGYIDNEGIYHFYIRDHLGSNRVVVKTDDILSSTGVPNVGEDAMARDGVFYNQYYRYKVVQRADYYPSGLLFPNMGDKDVQNYFYNGKEFDAMHGVNWLDVSARFYDAAIMRWHVPDKLTEVRYHLSPYVFCSNNPINRIDLDGMIDWSVVGLGAAQTFFGILAMAEGAAMTGATFGAALPLGGVIFIGGLGTTSFGIGQIVAGFASDGSAKANAMIESLPTSFIDLGGIMVDEGMGNENNEGRNVAKIIEGAFGVLTGSSSTIIGAIDLALSASSIAEGSMGLYNAHINSNNSKGLDISIVLPEVNVMAPKITYQQILDKANAPINQKLNELEKRMKALEQSQTDSDFSEIKFWHHYHLMRKAEEIRKKGEPISKDF